MNGRPATISAGARSTGLLRNRHTSAQSTSNGVIGSRKEGEGRLLERQARAHSRSRARGCSLSPPSKWRGISRSRSTPSSRGSGRLRSSPRHPARSRDVARHRGSRRLVGARRPLTQERALAVCPSRKRSFAGNPIFRCNVNFGEPHIVRYCATLQDGLFVTNREQPEMRCGRDASS